MTDTSIIIFLQKFQNPILNSIMNYITFLGYELGVTIILCIYIFGFSFHKGFFILQSSFLTFTSTDILKNSFMVKRPFLVDPSVLNLDRAMIKEAASGSVSYSFPSGHSSSITAGFSSMSLVIRKRIFYFISIIIIFLVLLSRLYLGVHRLVDILGGFALALIITLIYYIPLREYIDNNKDFPFNLIQFKNGKLIFTIFFILIPFLIIFIPVKFDRGNIGLLIGLNLGYLILGINLKNSYIEYKIKTIPILLRILFGFLIFFLLRLGLSSLFNLIFPENITENIYFRTIKYFLIGLFTIGLSLIVFIRAKLANIAKL